MYAIVFLPIAFLFLIWGEPTRNSNLGRFVRVVTFLETSCWLTQVSFCSNSFNHAYGMNF